jgi:hypothetical protein
MSGILVIADRGTGTTTGISRHPAWHQHHLGSPPAANSSARAGHESCDAGAISMRRRVAL